MDPSTAEIRADSAASGGLIRRVVLQNYRSIERCDVHLGPLTFLVGRNGAGKSNFLDALAFVQEAIDSTLGNAIARRGNLNGVRRRGRTRPRNFGIRLEFRDHAGSVGFYEFEVAAKTGGTFEVKHEQLRMGAPEGEQFFEVAAGVLKDASVSTLPAAVSSDRLYLTVASGLAPFRPAFDALRGMAVYKLNAEAMRPPRKPSPHDLLAPDGGNIASVFGRLGEASRVRKERVVEVLGAVVDGIVGVGRKELLGHETLEFRQEAHGIPGALTFDAGSVSDGTLLALAVLVSVSQGKRLGFVGIEEPETALHPAAGAALVDALREAASLTQIVLTTHSADLLDEARAAEGEVLCVWREDGTTRIARPDETALSAIRDNLYTAGELLRLEQLQPMSSPESSPLPLFRPVGAMA